MAESKVKEAKLMIVPEIEEEHGMAALPYHDARSPFKRSEGRNTAWQVLQDAGSAGLTTKEWVELVGDAGIRNPMMYVRFVQRAKRRVVVKKVDDNWVAVAPKKPRAKRTRK